MNFKLTFPLRLAVIGAMLGVFSPLLAKESVDMLSKARELVQQTANPQQTSSDAQRIEKLNQALTLTQQAPNHRLKGHRVKAIQDIRFAVAEIQKSDPDHKSADYLREAESELTASISLAGAGEGAQPAVQPSAAPVVNATSTPQPPVQASSINPADAAATTNVVTRFVANASSKPPGPVEEDVTDQFLDTFRTTIKMAQEEAKPRKNAPSLRQAIGEFVEFTLNGKLDLLFLEGPAAIVYGKAMLTKDGFADWKDDESSEEVIQNGKTVSKSNEASPIFGDGGGFVAFVGPRIKDAHVVVTFCLVQQHGQWKIHGLYFSNDVIGGDNRNFIIQQLSAFAAKFSQHPSTEAKKQVVTQPVTIRANPSGTIYGDVIDRGEPGEYGASISVQDVHPSKKGGGRDLSVQRKNDCQKCSQTFTASAPPFGADYAVVAWHGASFAISPTFHLDEKNCSQKVDLTIPEWKTLRRQFVDSEGKPAPGLAFEIDYTTPWKTGFVSGETGIHSEGTQGKLVIRASKANSSSWASGWLVTRSRKSS